MNARTTAKFFARLERVGDCWEWTGVLSDNGYSRFYMNGSMHYGHRVSFEHFTGPIPDGLEIDHLCRNRKCVNPDHLDAVTRRVNLLRSPIFRGNVQANATHCPSGHPYDEENTYRIPGRSHRLCRTCRRDRNRIAMRRIRSTASGRAA